MATNWTWESALSKVQSGGTQALTTAAVVPAVGDLMVCTAGNSSGTTVGTGFTIGDSSSGGATWTAILGTMQTTSKITLQGWWKVANAADNNAGSGITVTTTSTGGTGSFSSRSEVDIFRLPAGSANIQADIAASTGTASTVTTQSWSPASGTTHPNFTDALAFTSLYTGTVSNGGVTSTNTFTGTSAAANLALAVTTNDTLLANQFVGGVQASATAGTNVWENTWTTARPPAELGVTFVYSSGSGFLAIL